MNTTRQHTIFGWIIDRWNDFQGWLKDDPPVFVRVHQKDVYTSEKDVPDSMKGGEITPKE